MGEQKKRNWSLKQATTFVQFVVVECEKIFRRSNSGPTFFERSLRILPSHLDTLFQTTNEHNHPIHR